MKNTLILPKLVFIMTMALFLSSCNSASDARRDVAEGGPVADAQLPHWMADANIYEVNVRQYTPEGTFAAFSEHLDRLQDLGVKVLWFMPIQPIGEKNRKGSLGSYYSIADYTAINPEFGTMEDFKQLVEEIHARDMVVILDWVANHTAWDHHWTIEHPEYFSLDDNGNFHPPVDDWSDVIQLDYDNHHMRTTMIEEMRFWLEEANVDGFRCDVAYMVPTDFWVDARARLEDIRNVFMLAEAETPELNEEAFDAAYGWRLHHIMNNVAQGEKTVEAIDEYFFLDDAGGFPHGSFKMYFITNHDENSWAGTEFDRMGDGVEAFAVLTATIPGTMLIYSGQESGFDRMLMFFEKDEIQWDDFKYQGFYRKLNHLKASNQALWNGAHGGDIQRVNTSSNEQVFAFVREKNGDKVFVLLNLSDEPLNVELMGNIWYGEYTELFSEFHQTFDGSQHIFLQPWDYRVFVK